MNCSSAGGSPTDLAGFPASRKKPFDACRPEEQEQPGFRRIDAERVRDIAGAVHERAGDRFDHGVAMLDADLAGEDQEELVLRSVDVEW
jgi:hypothetical protein